MVSDRSPDPDMLVLQALALRSIGQIDGAIEACRKAMAASEDREDLILLTCDMIGARDGDAAALAFLEAQSAKFPDRRPLTVAIGIALSHAARRDEALAVFQRALVQDAADPETALRAAHIALEEGDIIVAIDLVEQTAQAVEATASVLVQGAVLSAEAGQQEAAERLLTKAEAIAPLTGETAHIAASVRGVTDTALSPDEIADQFDHHAASFDRNLAALRYAGPDMIAQALADAGLDQLRGLDVIDAGCGTGLCGPVVLPLAATLTGIDLSPEMVRHAETRGCYDAVAAQDIRSLAEDYNASFDLLISADVLGYFGDLTEPLASFRACLRPGGHAIVTVEALEDPDQPLGYYLRPSGRHAHSTQYLKQAMRSAGFTLACPENYATLRFQYDRPVYGTTMVGLVSVPSEER